MKQVTFIKKHPSGIAEGHTTSLGDLHAKRLADEGYITIDGEVTESNKSNEKPEEEPEFIKHVLTKKDIKEGAYPNIPEDAKPGDEIEIPNPKYIPNE